MLLRESEFSAKTRYQSWTGRIATPSRDFSTSQTHHHHRNPSRRFTGRRASSWYILLSVGEIESYNRLFSSRVAASRIESIKRTLSTPPPPHTFEHILHPARFQLSNPTPQHHRRCRLRVGRFLVTRTPCRRILEEVLVPADGPQFTIDSNLTRSQKLLVRDQVN